MPVNTEPFLWLLWHTTLMRILVSDNKPQVSTLDIPTLDTPTLNIRFFMAI